MKKLLLFLLWLFSQHCFAQCDPSAVVFSLAPGYSKSGVLLSMEGGFWPVTRKFGAMVGLSMYNQDVVIKGEKEMNVYLDVVGRILYKVTKISSNFPQVFTLYGSVYGMYGASYRAYVSPSDDILIGIEPTISNKNGFGINIVFTTRL